MMTDKNAMPRHITVVMDGNGRWAKKRFMPRIAGHRVGVNAVEKTINFCVSNNIEVLSLFAMSVENFKSRPDSEVQFLVSLLSEMLMKKLDAMNKNRIRIRIIGDLTVFEEKVQRQLAESQNLTKHNSGLNLVLAINYSGRWDILQASKKMAQHAIEKGISPDALTESDFASFLCIADLPEPDLFIRTSGEQRISNFMLWQLAYTELCFLELLWPDFDEAALTQAIETFQKRDRRFGKVIETA